MASEPGAGSVMEQDDDGSDGPPPPLLAPSDQVTDHFLIRCLKQTWRLLTRGSTKTAQEEAEEKQRLVAMADYLYDGQPSTMQLRFLKINKCIRAAIRDRGTREEALQVLCKLVKELNARDQALEMERDLALERERDRLLREIDVLERYEAALTAVLDSLGVTNVQLPVGDVNDDDSGIHM